MSASRQVEIPFYRIISRPRERGADALAQVIGRTAIPIMRKYTVPAAKLVGSVGNCCATNCKFCYW